MKSPQKDNHPPITVATSNVTESKMRAIVSLASATEALSKALNSINTAITISNCSITNKNGEPAITIKGDNE